MKKLYVGNISWNATEEELFDHFIAAGHRPNEVKLMYDRDTNKPRGFGFVTLPEDADMNRVIDDLNGQPFQGRPLTINEARPMEKRQRSSSGYSRGEPRW